MSTIKKTRRYLSMAKSKTLVSGVEKDIPFIYTSEGISPQKLKG